MAQPLLALQNFKLIKYRTEDDTMRTETERTYLLAINDL